jgi:hypothetical protein
VSIGSEKCRRKEPLNDSKRIGQVSPKCPHFLKTKGIEQVLVGCKGLEKTKIRGQVVDKINRSLGSHGGDRGSEPLGSASFQSRFSDCHRPFSPGVFPRFWEGCPGAGSWLGRHTDHKTILTYVLAQKLAAISCYFKINSCDNLGMDRSGRS